MTSSLVSHFTDQFPDHPGTSKPHRRAVQVLQQLAVLRPGQNRVGVERLLDRQPLVIVKWPVPSAAVGGTPKDHEDDVRCMSPGITSGTARALFRRMSDPIC